MAGLTDEKTAADPDLVSLANYIHRNLSIAGVTFVISGGLSQRLQVYQSRYRSFISAAAVRKGVPSINVKIFSGTMPSLNRLEKIFDTKESWALFRDEKYYWVSYHPARYPKPFWIARFDRSANLVEYYCESQEQVNRKKSKDIFHPVCYPLDQLLLMYFLAARKGILTHAAGVVRGGKAFIFPGESGAGKSTFSQLLAKAKIGTLLSDERMIIRKINGVMQAFGTPWAGTAGIARNGSAPLAGIYFLKHDQNNHIEKLTANEALDKFLPLISIPWYDHDTMTRIITFAKQLVAKVPAFEMSFQPDRSAVDFFWKFQKTAS